MKTNKLFLIVALLGTVLAGCQKIEKEIDAPEEQPATENVWKLVVQATKDVDTKALDYDGNQTLDAYWKKGETVDVYLVGGDKVGTLSVTSDDKVNPATLEGDIETDDLSVGSNLWLLFPSSTGKTWSYLDQDGAAPDEAFDYATASVKVETLDEVKKTITTSTENAKFTNQQSVYRFGFKVSGSAISVKSFTLSSTENKIVRTRSYGGNDWTSVYGSITANPTSAPAGNLYFMSVRNENTGSTNNYSFSVIGSDNALYEGEKAINKQLQNGKLYNASVNIAQKTLAPISTTVSEEMKVL